MTGGILWALLAPAACAAKGARAPLPGGGSVLLPSAYEPILEGDYRRKDAGALIAYRHYRSMLSGTNECDGMIAVARKREHQSLRDFVMSARGALTARWAYGDEMPPRFVDPHETFPLVESDGLNGPELTQALLVSIVGFFGVYDKRARLYAVDDARGLMIAVWIFDSHGGDATARNMAEAVALSLLD